MTESSFQNLHTQFPQYHWRAAKKADAGKILAMLLVRDEHDDIDGAGTVEGLQREFDDPWLQNPDTDFILALSEEDDVAAFCAVFVDPDSQNQRKAGLWIEVHPDHRGADLRKTLMVWAENRAGELLENLNPELEAVIRVSCEQKLVERTQFYKDCGFQPERYFFHMVRDLNKAIPKIKNLKGFDLIPYDAELDDALFAAFNEAFLDHWSFEPISKEEWGIWFTSAEDFRPDLSFLVMAGDQIAGFTINGVSPELNERKGLQEGWIHQLGTRSEWRRRGVASNLIIASLHAFKRDGLDFAKLGVDTQNLTGALQLYERLGFESEKSFVVLQKKFIQR